MTICGIDEAGRGSLAGPVFAASVILSSDFPTHLLKDSKKLSPSKREALCKQIMASCTVGYAMVDVAKIDEINILQASLLAMSLAYANMPSPANMALVDGNQSPKLPIKLETIVKGDDKIFEIMAASIVAKVMRDDYMVKLDKLEPRYGFAKHKGYGTAIHAAAIKEHGYCVYHRKLFKLKKLDLF